MCEHECSGDEGFVNLARWCRLNDTSRHTAYRLIERGQLKAVKAGNRVKITRASAKRYANSLPPLCNKHKDS